MCQAIVTGSNFALSLTVVNDLPFSVLLVHLTNRGWSENVLKTSL